MRALGCPRGMRIPGENGHELALVPIGDQNNRLLLRATLGATLRACPTISLRLWKRSRGCASWQRCCGSLPDPTDASRTRNQVTAAGIAINAQLRADEARLKVKVSEDVLGRLLADIEKYRRQQEAEEAAAKEVGGDVPAIGQLPDDAGETS